ncbi:MAG: hypothetical protein ACE1ZE_06470 [Candidatus Binatia bacterium]
MYEKMRVKYLFVNLEYPTYIKLQAVLAVAWMMGGLLSFLYGRDSQMWLLQNGWWFGPCVALLEVIEAFVAVNKAKREFNDPTRTLPNTHPHPEDSSMASTLEPER